MKTLISLLAALTVVTPLHAAPVVPPVAQARVMTEGVVRRIDPANGKLTLRHGPIVNLDMPAMTMVFRVQDPAMLDKVKPGDKVRFRAENLKGALTVTILEPAAP